jgi:hypothetical protein
LNVPLRVAIAFVAITLLPLSIGRADSGLDAVARRIERDFGASARVFPCSEWRQGSHVRLDLAVCMWDL